jgi:hypothetical protein
MIQRRAVTCATAFPLYSKEKQCKPDVERANEPSVLPFEARVQIQAWCLTDQAFEIDHGVSESVASQQPGLTAWSCVVCRPEGPSQISPRQSDQRERRPGLG